MSSGRGTMNSDSTMGSGPSTKSGQQKMEEDEESTGSGTSTDMNTVPTQSGPGTMSPTTTTPTSP